MSDRTMFEAWASDNGKWPASVERSGDEYKLMQTQASWRAWQAAIAALMGGGEPVAVVGDFYALYWIGSGPIAPIIERTGLKPGDKLYTHPAPAVDGAVLRDAERYRWLRQQHKKHLGLTICAVGMFEVTPWSGDDPDTAVDDAMKGQGNAK